MASLPVLAARKLYTGPSELISFREDADLSADSKFSRVSNFVRDIAAPASCWAVASRECSNVRMMVVLVPFEGKGIEMERNSGNLTSGDY
jgi:hypothetical protein